jgi:SAM-dependent methyltransferase
MSAIGRLKSALPWWAKIAAKLVLARLPLGGRAWQSLGLFSPGEMDDPDYALAVFDRHYRAAGAPAPGFSFVELGPGDSLASAVIGRAYGAARGWLIDSGAYATGNMDFYLALAGRLAAKLETSDAAAARDAVRGAAGRDEMLGALGMRYLQTGLAGLGEVPPESCQMVFSQAVLEHVPRADFVATLAEIRRILAPGGVATHQIDFRDHLGGGLNNLRFSEALWEAPWFARRSGFYTNRLRLSEMTAMAGAAGLTVDVADRQSWAVPPIDRAALAAPFATLVDADLATRDAFVILRRQEAAA